MQLIIVFLILGFLLLLCIVFGWITFYLWRRTVKLSKCTQNSLRKEVDPILVPTISLDNSPILIGIDKRKEASHPTVMSGISPVRSTSTPGGDDSPNLLLEKSQNKGFSGPILLNNYEVETESISTWSNNVEHSPDSKQPKSEPSSDEDVLTDGDEENDNPSQDDISELSSSTLDSVKQVLGIHQVYPDYILESTNLVTKKDVQSNVATGKDGMNSEKLPQMATTILDVNCNPPFQQLYSMPQMEPLATNKIIGNPCTPIQGDSTLPKGYKDFLEGYFAKMESGKWQQNVGSNEKVWVENKFKRKDSTSSDISDPTWTESCNGAQQGETKKAGLDDEQATRGGLNQSDIIETVQDDPFKTESVGSSGEGSTIKAQSNREAEDGDIPLTEKQVKPQMSSVTTFMDVNKTMSASDTNLAAMNKASINAVSRSQTIKPPVGSASNLTSSTISPAAGSASASPSSKHVASSTGDKKRMVFSLPKTVHASPVVGHRKKL
jgi:hypothetical protein